MSEDIMPSNLVNISSRTRHSRLAFPERIARGSAITGQNGNFRLTSTLPENRCSCSRLDDPADSDNTR